MKTVWMLAIALKSLVQAVRFCCHSSDIAALFDWRQFVQSVSYLAMQGTGFSRHWVITDLEVSRPQIVSSAWVSEPPPITWFFRSARVHTQMASGSVCLFLYGLWFSPTDTQRL